LLIPILLHRICAVCCSVLQCVAVCCSVLQCWAVCCSELKCSVMCCNVWQCVLWCGASLISLLVLFLAPSHRICVVCYHVLRRVAACYSVWQRVFIFSTSRIVYPHPDAQNVRRVLQWVAVGCSVLQMCCRCVAVCFSVFQCVVVCCSVFQCVAVCCGVLQCWSSLKSSHCESCCTESTCVRSCVCVGTQVFAVDTYLHMHNCVLVCVCVRMYMYYV